MLNLKTKHIITSRDIEWDKMVEEVNNKFDDQDEDEDKFIEEIKKEPDAPVDGEERVLSQNSCMK
jgi:hypothetical protein